MKKVFILIISLFLITNVNANKKDITNLNFKPSVDKGKIGKAYEIVKAESGEPVIGESAYKFIAIPFDCGEDEYSSHTDCGTLDKKNAFLSKGDRVRSELAAADKNSRFSGEQWFSFSIYIPEDYKTISPTITSFYQIFESGNGPALKIEDNWGTMIANIMIKGGTVEIRNLISINDMKGKWTHVVMNNNYSKNKEKGFYNIWVNSKYTASYEGKTYGGGAKGLYVKAGLYQTYISRYLKKIGVKPEWVKGQDPGKFPTQIIYLDNIYRTTSKKKLENILSKKFENYQLPKGLDVNFLKIPNLQDYCNTKNKNLFCAVAVSHSDTSLKFLGEDPNEGTAKMKANRKCFQKFKDCKVIYLEKQN